MKRVFEPIGGNKKINAKQDKKERNKGKYSLKGPPKVRFSNHNMHLSLGMIWVAGSDFSHPILAKSVYKT
jgi:hypothetical protein